MDIFSFSGEPLLIEGGGNDRVYLSSGKDTVILGNTGFADIYGFGRNDQLDVSGLDVSFTQMGGNTLINSGDSLLGVLNHYTGSVALV